VQHALWQHQGITGSLQGLIIYLDMAWKYTHIFFSRVLTFRERIEHACYIIHFLRLWRAWVYLEEGHTVTEHFLTRENSFDTVMSCHSAINIILLYAVYFPKTPPTHGSSRHGLCRETLLGGARKLAGQQARLQLPNHVSVRTQVELAGSGDHAGQSAGPRDAASQ
jgi:hypothetical protein